MNYTKDTNNDNIIALRETLNDTNQKNILFYGAGVSRCAGFCAWSELLKNLGNLCCTKHCSYKDKQCKEKSFNPDKCKLESIEEYRKYKGRNDYSSLILVKYLKEILKLDYNNYMENYFNKRGESNIIQENLLKTIAQMPFDSYITTNYERTFRDVLNNNYTVPIKPYNYHTDIDIFRKFIADVEAKDAKGILFIHGEGSSSESFILDIDDYKNAYNIIDETDNENEKIKKVVLNIAILLDRYNITYLGFSMDDPAIKMIQKLNFKRNIEFDDKKRNFIILPYKRGKSFKDFEELESHYGLRVIYYPVKDNHYEKGLLKFLRDDLRLNIESPIKPKISDEPNANNNLNILFNERGTM